MAGPLPISFREIYAWALITGSEPWAWEIRALRQMDAAYLSALAGPTPISRDEPSATIDASDGREVAGFMRMMAQRKKG